MVSTTQKGWKGIRTNPSVMWFVDVFVEEREMKPSVYPIDAIIGEE